MTHYEELRARHVADATAAMPEMVARLDWPADRLAEHRQAELRRLIRVARDLSPWHRKRLADVNPDEVDESTLTQLPVMTKDDLMEHFDEIVTDDRLRRSVVEDHVQGLRSDAYLFDRYHACASSGSTGRRGVFVYDWDAWVSLYWGMMRSLPRLARLHPELAGALQRLAGVAAEAPTHVSAALLQTFANPQLPTRQVPVTLPLAEQVATLNEIEPTALGGYPSALNCLAAEARAGRLRTAPLLVAGVGEALLPEIRAELEDAFDAMVVNLYGTSEGGLADSCGAGPWLHLADDLAVIEPVDVAGAPVPAGECSDKIYLTNLYNHALPLIRYEVTDQFTVLPGDCPCGCVHTRIADPQGRLDDTFHYGDVAVHPHVFRSPLSRRREIVEYHVRQTPRGAAVSARCTEPIDVPGLEAEIASGLTRLGVPEPKIVVSPVEQIARGVTGKLTRFVALPQTP